jgi:hypothetical protein
MFFQNSAGLHYRLDYERHTFLQKFHNLLPDYIVAYPITQQSGSVLKDKSFDNGGTR